MKVIFPQNIEKGIFTMKISIGSFSISMIQMLIMSVGIMFSVVTFSTCAKADAKALGIILAIIIVLFFGVISFFKVSELGLLPFLAKKIKDNFFDTPTKFQQNFTKANPIDIMIAKTKKEQGKQKIEIKKSINLQDIQQMENHTML